jgi:hypothetical protein
MIWVAKDSGLFRVRYWPLDTPSSPVTAQVVSGTLVGYDGTSSSWASRMSFQPGCWQIAGRLGDVSLRFIVQVVLGNS